MKIFITPKASEVKINLKKNNISVVSCRQTGKSISIVVDKIHSSLLVKFLNENGFCHTWGDVVCRASKCSPTQKLIEYSGMFLRYGKTN